VLQTKSSEDLSLMLGTKVIWIALLAGFLGAMTDSLLGATVQQMRRCPGCDKEVEHINHCGVPTIRIRGWSWMNNDAVNVISSLIGGGIAVIIWFCYYGF